MVRVLVVDDHDLMRSGLIGMLQKSPEITVVGQAANGGDAVTLYESLQPDVVLMDVRMPGMDGIRATQTILRRFDNACIIAVTACNQEALARQMLRAGALGYVTKNADIDEVLIAIRRARRGERYLSGDLGVQLDTSRLGAGEPLGDLSVRELEIFKHVVAGRKAKEIARRMYISSATVHTYRYRIFDKLGVHSDVELTRLALEQGLIKE